jgi:probable HAF family extracellular repeat protein
MMCIARPVVASLALGLALSSASPVHAQYAARDVGSLPGAFYTSAADVNARGDAVGVSGLPFGPAVLWTGGGVAAIPGLNTAVAINNRGQVVGDGVVPSGDFHGFLFERGVLTDLGTLPGLPASRVADINERGDIAGISYRSGGSELQMVLWISGVIQDHGPLPLGEGVVKGINERRQIVGYSQNPLVTRGWVWQDGVFTMLPLPDGATDSFAWDINDRGDIVGVAVGESTHAVLWPAGGGVIDLGALPGHSGSWAQGIDNRGQVVGWSAGPDGFYRPFLWRAGTMIDLDILPGHTQGAASAISDAGVVVGESIAADFSRHATVWTLTARDR